MKISLSKKAEEATTIMEVTVAIVIILITVVGLLGCFSYGFFAMQLARENQRATQILLEKVETLRLYSWDQINSNGFIPQTFTDVYDPQSPTGYQGVKYSGSFIISNFPPVVSYSNNLRQVVIHVQWTNNRSFISRGRTITTLVAKDGLQNYVY